MKKIAIFSILLFSLTLSACNRQEEVINDNKEAGDKISSENFEADRQEDEVKNAEEEVVISSTNKKIKIFDIKANDSIASPITIKGEGVAFENNLIVELRNKDHVALVKEYVTIKSDEVDKSGPFSITLNFQFSNTKEGFIAVYEPSVEDGRELNLVEIPVKFGVINIE